jgi:hypothetical protein
VLVHCLSAFGFSHDRWQGLPLAIGTVPLTHVNAVKTNLNPTQDTEEDYFKKVFLIRVITLSAYDFTVWCIDNSYSGLMNGPLLQTDIKFR